MAHETHEMPRLAFLDQVSVVLGSHTILDGLDFTLDRGQVAGVTGPNGSGKTTLLRTLATLVRIEDGQGEVLGIDVNGDDLSPIRPSIGLISHNPTTIPHLSLRENLDHVARLKSLERSRVDQVLHVVGLDEVSARPARNSSYGMQRRLEVARLLLTNPRLLLLDESVSGLDAAASELVSALIERTISNGGGVVMVSHDIDLLERTCHSLLHLDRGRLEELT